ncbi:MAG: N-formylglutamate amidohydrolase [Planctomycetota bacterium]
MILHVPHSSDAIPEQFRDQIVLSDAELRAELLLMTDAFTDELFAFPAATVLRFPISRLLVDVERFPGDAQEPMSKVGMGMIYTRTAHGKKLKRTLLPEEARHLASRYYEPHHQLLTAAVKIELEQHRTALIVDCHSFPSRPLPCDRDQSIPRPQFCIGTDAFHTPQALSQATAHHVEKMGYGVQMNQPYEGALVPMEFFQNNRQVASIMIEVNRSLYMDELTGAKRETFESTRRQIQRLLSSLAKFQMESAL